MKEIYNNKKTISPCKISAKKQKPDEKSQSIKRFQVCEYNEHPTHTVTSHSVPTLGLIHPIHIKDPLHFERCQIFESQKQIWGGT